MLLVFFRLPLIKVSHLNLLDFDGHISIVMHRDRSGYTAFRIGVLLLLNGLNQLALALALICRKVHSRELNDALKDHVNELNI